MQCLKSARSDVVLTMARRCGALQQRSWAVTLWHNTAQVHLVMQSLAASPFDAGLVVLQLAAQRWEAILSGFTVCCRRARPQQMCAAQDTVPSRPTEVTSWPPSQRQLQHPGCAPDAAPPQHPLSAPTLRARATSAAPALLGASGTSATPPLLMARAPPAAALPVTSSCIDSRAVSHAVSHEHES
jgi:hypothetical protein